LSRYVFQFGVGVLCFSDIVPRNIQAHSLNFRKCPGNPLSRLSPPVLPLPSTRIPPTTNQLPIMADIPFGVILSGAESQRLRTFCTSEGWTAKDLDSFARLLQHGPLEAVRARDYSPAGKRRTLEALKYFIQKGGDITTCLMVMGLRLKTLATRCGSSSLR
jgi:hypothetical protein